MSIVPAQLWIGENRALLKACNTYLKENFCLNNICNKCITCKNIDLKQHCSVVWIESDKSYIKADINIIFDKILFKLNLLEQFFFIISNAELLTAATANSLLKTIEEPPAGYKFIFLASRPALVIPTIVSRCVVKNFESSLVQENIFLNFFKNAKLDNLSELKVLLDKNDIAEFEVNNLLDNLFNYWTELYKNALKLEQNSLVLLAKQKCDLISESYNYLPMPGSSKFFLRNLFLRLC